MGATEARRAFVVAWIVLGLAGALNHTIAEKVVGRRFDLFLPHIAYGHVMFNKNERVATTFEYARADGVRHNIADLVATPALGYKRARVALNVLVNKSYLAEVCFRATRDSHESFTFYVDEFDVDANPRRPARTFVLRCDARGLAPR